MTNFPNPKPHIGKGEATSSPLPVPSKEAKEEIIKEAREITERVEKLKEKHPESFPQVNISL